MTIELHSLRSLVVSRYSDYQLALVVGDEKK